MKSSTIRRSALSRESMDVIENLANETPADYSQNSETNDYAPSEYYREAEHRDADNKSKEIDLLWQSFKSAQFNTKSPAMHWIGGFILGVITTVVAMSLFGMFVANSDNTSLKNQMPLFGAKTQVQKIDDVEEASTMINEQNIPGDEVDAPVVSEEKLTENKKAQKVSKEEKSEVKTPIKTKKYIIKDGDTVEAIIKRNYGSYTPERAEAIMKANNLKDLDHISIDQELLLPIEK